MDNKIIGLIVVIGCSIGVIAYALFVEGSAGGFGNFLSIPSFSFVVGVGGGFTYMRKHALKENELGIALKKDFILAGWIGTMVGLVLMGAGYGGEGGFNNLGGGAAAAIICPLYGYMFGNIVEAMMSE